MGVSSAKYGGFISQLWGGSSTNYGGGHQPRMGGGIYIPTSMYRKSKSTEFSLATHTSCTTYNTERQDPMSCEERSCNGLCPGIWFIVLCTPNPAWPWSLTIGHNNIIRPPKCTKVHIDFMSNGHRNGNITPAAIRIRFSHVAQHIICIIFTESANPY